ncbi:hypothetical protein LTR56_021023 [Elasticomyces elasticus]|nr:hypothetical protein LTR56_021023 [Elasticomyces elasticus]KAK3646943.1 hypothetical protein LTR22_014096 [Elasticomyces elasticus]KAK4909884.1 hypothetical protein LTR49_021369 [Elasticomyces elasticus]KAK5766535.1 hypothetical protein LTS12_003153 [Elasticomyces elasticus]
MDWSANLSIRNTAVATATPAKQGQQTISVTIEEARSKYEKKYEKARQPIDPAADPYLQALHGSGVEVTVPVTLRDFLKEVEGVPYYQLKAYIYLSYFDEDNDYSRNLRACCRWLDEAIKAMALCKATYFSDEDVKALEEFEGIILRERAELRKRGGCC